MLMLHTIITQIQSGASKLRRELRVAMHLRRQAAKVLLQKN